MTVTSWVSIGVTFEVEHSYCFRKQFPSFIYVNVICSLQTVQLIVYGAQITTYITLRQILNMLVAKKMDNVALLNKM